jgi:hypothetical protein
MDKPFLGVPFSRFSQASRGAFQMGKIVQEQTENGVYLELPLMD